VIFVPLRVTQRGNWDKTSSFLKKMSDGDLFATLDQFGQAGVAALSGATPADTGLTSQSWYYEIVRRPGYYSILWRNSHTENGRPIAILLQYGHATRQGGYVQGRDYIMPAIRPIFDQIDAEMRKVVNG
jgi:hypothetical protein